MKTGLCLLVVMAAISAWLGGSALAAGPSSLEGPAIAAVLQTASPGPPSPAAATATPLMLGEKWLPVDGGEDLIQDASWESLPRVEVVEDRLVVSAEEEGYAAAINRDGLLIEGDGPFAIAADIEAAENTMASVSLYGKLSDGEWWQGVRRLDVGVISDTVLAIVYDGTQPEPSAVYDLGTTRTPRRVQWEVRVGNGSLAFLVAGREVRQAADPGMFIDGRVYLGVNVSPSNILTVHSLSALIPEGQEEGLTVRKRAGR